MKIALCNLFVVVLQIGLTVAPQAYGEALVTNDGTGKLRDDVSVTLGYEFKVGESDIVVSALGFWDSGADGLAVAHQVGLWSSDGKLLRSVTVPSGEESTLVGKFRYVKLVTPISLQSGQTYTLGAELFDKSGDSFRDVGDLSFQPAVAGFASEITSVVGRNSIRKFFDRPTGDAGKGVAYLGPNALFTRAKDR